MRDEHLYANVEQATGFSVDKGARTSHFADHEAMTAGLRKMLSERSELFEQLEQGLRDTPAKKLLQGLFGGTTVSQIVSKDPSKPGPRPFVPLPTVGAGDDKMDVMSRLLKDRILLLGSGVDDEVANVLVAQLLYLAKEKETSDITLYINSPGGSVSAGLAIFDTMQYVPCDVNTVCFGTAASMGAFLLGAGTPGKRRSLPNARIMIHQPLGGAQGQASDIEIQAKEILFIRSLLNEYISDYTGQPVDKVEDDCDRDFFMTPEEAKEIGRASCRERV